MKNLRRYYTRKQVAEELDMKSYEVTNRLVHLRALCNQEIKKQMKKIMLLTPVGKKYTQYQIDAIRQYYQKPKLSVMKNTIDDMAGPILFLNNEDFNKYQETKTTTL